MKLKRMLTGLGLALFVAVTAAWPTPAWAADDQIDSWQIAYTVGSDGVLHVQETLVYQFGSGSGRYGFDRMLTTREPWGSTDQDAVFAITNIMVTSPDVPPAFSLSTVGTGRAQQLRIRVGSPLMMVKTPTAKYTITYDVAGALRSSGNYDELRWDAVGADTPLVNNLSITTTVPGGVRALDCHAGPPNTSRPCTYTNIDAAGVGTIDQTPKPAGDVVTISAMITAGMAHNNQPNLVLRQDETTTVITRIGLALTGLAIVVTVGVVTVMARRRRRDERVGDGPPELRAGSTPPDLPVALAGLLDRGVVGPQALTAALLSLAARGAIQLRQSSGAKAGPAAKARARLVNRDIAMAPHEARLLDDIFRKKKDGDEKALTRLYKPYRNMQSAVLTEATDAHWYLREPSGFAMTRRDVLARVIPGAALCLAGLCLVGVFLAVLLPVGVVLAVAAMAGAPLVVAVGRVTYWLLTMRGQRSASGRAYADQVAGFRKFLATVQPDQIRFEESQDIFSEYLPWAVVFGLTNRWVSICDQLVAQGRQNTIQPSWYCGDKGTFSTAAFTESLGGIERATFAASGGSGGAHSW